MNTVMTKNELTHEVAMKIEEVKEKLEWMHEHEQNIKVDEDIHHALFGNNKYLKYQTSQDLVSVLEMSDHDLELVIAKVYDDQCSGHLWTTENDVEYCEKCETIKS